jgi:hypothetical protein
MWHFAVGTLLDGIGADSIPAVASMGGVPDGPHALRYQPITATLFEGEAMPRLPVLPEDDQSAPGPSHQSRGLARLPRVKGAPVVHQDLRSCRLSGCSWWRSTARVSSVRPD